tara:strand:- start:214 stop:1356 length:1143 start_codon:yes stop_codon:yes gene_type:complete
MNLIPSKNVMLGNIVSDNNFKGLFGGIYKNRRVLVTGHTGFKGSWLCKWLEILGAKVVGYALRSVTTPNHFDLSHLKFMSHFEDVRDYKKIQKTFSEFEPEIVFHLAAQPCVLASYDNPLQTFSSNIMGSVNILEASRHTNSVKAVIMVTTDKVYKNNEWIYGYRETDTIGGHDPYSSSKACMELVTESYRKSYSESSHNELLIASARAGNVIGGGDWTENRIITDVIKAATKGEKVLLRNPKSSRPWQHVLESLSGYLLLGQKLHTNNLYAADSWNFGPALESNLNVEDLIYLMGEKWEKISWKNVTNDNLGYESKALMVDSSKANNLLGWRPVWDIKKTIHHTIEWYRKYLEENRVITEEQIENYITDAKENNCIWAL